MTAATAASSSAGPPRPAAPFRLGVVGCGRVFERYYAPALQGHPDWRLAAACDPLPERRAWTRRAFADATDFASHTELLTQAEVDAVLVTAPPDAHCRIAGAALARGLPVLVEKPMALDVAEGLRLLQAARQAKQPLSVGFNRRFWEPFADLREHMQAWAGPVSPSIKYVLTTNPQDWSPLTPPQPQSLGEQALLDDLASHQVDLLSWLFGRRIERVAAQRLRWPSPSDEAIQYELQFQQGLTAQCLVSHCRYYSERLEIDLPGRRWLASQGVLLGSRRLSMSALRAQAGVRSLSGSLSARLRRKPSATVQSFSRQLQSFAEYLRAPSPDNSIADGEAGLRATAALEACRASLTSDGRWAEVTVEFEVMQ